VRGVAFEKAVRRKPLARRARYLCKLNGAREVCRGCRGGRGPWRRRRRAWGRAKWRLKRNLLWGMKKVSSGDGDTLRRSALKRASSWGCGRVISCSCDQERWRTKLELCRGESFDDGHRSAALGTAPQRVRCRSGRGFRFVFRWSGVKSGEALWQQGGAPSVGEEAEVADADEALGEQVK
jgi:hypothetical protein